MVHWFWSQKFDDASFSQFALNKSAIEHVQSAHHGVEVIYTSEIQLAWLHGTLSSYK